VRKALRFCTELATGPTSSGWTESTMSKSRTIRAAPTSTCDRAARTSRAVLFSPSAEPAGASVAAATSQIEAALDDGEVVLLAIKPSSWFVLLVSLPVIMGVAVLGALAAAADKLVGLEGIPLRPLATVIMGIICLRIVAAMFQWIGRLYVLTNRRVLDVCGVVHPHVTGQMLNRLAPPELSVTVSQRLMGTGSLLFRTRTNSAPPIEWEHISQPEQVRRTVAEAIARNG